MKTIAFFGLGNMGSGMARNLINSGFNLQIYDLVEENMHPFENTTALLAKSLDEAVTGAEIIISMLPAGEHVKTLLLGSQGIARKAKKNALFIDCSTIEAQVSKSIAKELIALGHRFCDAPVSGGVAGASAGTLTFIVGGGLDAFEQAQEVLQAMGSNIFHAGDVGAGQVAKICNNMLLAILMTGTSEALRMAIDNGIDASVMSQIMSKSSGNNWTLEKYNPCPGVMPNVPSSNGYTGGFMVDLMNKDLGLAMNTADLHKTATPMGSLARALYLLHGKAGNGQLDFSSIFEFYSNNSCN